jgi:hypothetical protein
MPLSRKLLLPLTWVCWAALTSCGVASIQPGAPTVPANPAPSQPAQEQSQEAMPELGVFDDGDLDNSLDPGPSEALGEGSLLDE